MSRPTPPLVIVDRDGHVTDLHLVSHGQEKGPLKVLHSEEQKFQPTPAQVVRFIP